MSVLLRRAAALLAVVAVSAPALAAQRNACRRRGRAAAHARVAIGRRVCDRVAL